MQDHSTPDHFTGRITTIYCLCDDFLRAWGHRGAPQAKMTTAQVMTVALVAAALFGGNQERSRCFLQEHGYIRRVLSKGALNRRLHEVPEAIWQALFKLLADVHKQLNERQEYAVDSLPVPVCDNICRSATTSASADATSTRARTGGGSAETGAEQVGHLRSRKASGATSPARSATSTG